MDPKTRFLTTLQHEEPDRVPLLDLGIDSIPILKKYGARSLDVEAYVKKLIKICAPGGGYILISGHSISYSVTLENYEMMLESTRNYGTYPINIE